MPLTHRGFKAWIYCENGGQILEEYMAGQDPEDERVYTCWIASESGKRFTIKWESLINCDSRGVVSVNGVETDRTTHCVSSNLSGTSIGVWTDARTIRPYVFSDVIFTDDNSYLGVKQSTNTDKVGDITLKVYLGRVVRDNKFHPRKFLDVALNDGAILESTKKICNHRIALGEAIPLGPHQEPKSYWEYSDRTTAHVVFHFKYRPREHLQAQEIIPPVGIRDASQEHVIIIGDDEDDLVGGTAKPSRKKRKKPLSGPSQLREPLQTPHREGTSRPVFFEAPRSMKQDEDVIILGYSEGKKKVKREGNSEDPHMKRLKREPTDPVRPENGIRLWVDGNGSIDLTMDD